MESVAHHLEGQLTATIHGTAKDLSEFSSLVSILENRVGRLLFNGFATGVEVCPSIQHGGPYPATTEDRTTSVGTAQSSGLRAPLPARTFRKQRCPRGPSGRQPTRDLAIVDRETRRGWAVECSVSGECSESEPSQAFAPMVLPRRRVVTIRVGKQLTI
jgi:NADP-dependent aldehyde dehydrogenase